MCYSIIMHDGSTKADNEDGADNRDGPAPRTTVPPLPDPPKLIEETDEWFAATDTSDWTE